MWDHLLRVEQGEARWGFIFGYVGLRCRLDIHMKMIRLWNAEEVVGERTWYGDSASTGDDPGSLQQEGKSRPRTGLRDCWSAPMKDTQTKQAECQGKTRKGWCPRGEGTESCKEGGYHGQTPGMATGMGQRKVHWFQQHGGY